VHRYSTVLVVALWVMVLSSGIAAYVLVDTRDDVQVEFDAAATLRVAALQRSIDEKLLILQSMHSFFSTVDGNPQLQFRTFVQPFEERLQGVQALQWVVPVRAEEREEFERNLQQAGISGFQITERVNVGDTTMMRAGERPVYYPVYPLLPYDATEASVGFDIASSPGRLWALEAAIATRQMAASRRLTLLQSDTPGIYGFIVLLPLFRQNDAAELAGLIMGVFHIGNIMDAVEQQFGAAALDVGIIDVNAEPGAEQLYLSPVRQNGSDPWLATFIRPREHVQQVFVADRRWEVHTSAAPGYMTGRQPWMAAAILAAGALLALGLSVYLTLRARHEARLQQIDKQRESLENQLLRAQRLEAIGQMVSGIAHDFRNLLQTVLGNAEILLSDPAEVRPQVRQQLGHIRHAAVLGNGLIQKLLSFSRNEPAIATALDLAPQVHNTVALLRTLIPADIALDLELAKDLPRVMIDATSFDQVLINLCINARDAISGAGSIRVSLQHALPDEGNCHSCKAAAVGAAVVLEIADTGSGIAPGKLASIFDPFFTTKVEGKGSGLGLSIVHTIVHAAGGHILLHSTPGEGTTFRILLPAAAV
jgi:signal transduction histidine kinase